MLSPRRVYLALSISRPLPFLHTFFCFLTPRECLSVNMNVETQAALPSYFRRWTVQV